MEVNGWGLHCSYVFDTILNDLISAVLDLKEKNPTGYINHENAKLLKRVYRAISEDVPQDPTDQKFHLGKNALGKHRQAWKRIKAGLPDRYRLFFRYSTKNQTVVYAWLNNKNCLRQAGAKTDVYRVFKTKLRKGEIAENYKILLETATDVPLIEE